MPAATSAVFVSSLLKFEPDIADPANNTVVRWDFQLLFCGDTAAMQGEVVVANDASKAAIKTAINDHMIAALLDLGFTLNTNRIYTIADLAG